MMHQGLLLYADAHLTGAIAVLPGKHGGAAMSVQSAGNPFMSSRLIEATQEPWNYVGPEAYGLSAEDVVYRVMRRRWTTCGGSGRRICG